jgi:hypothetical protein
MWVRSFLVAMGVLCSSAALALDFDEARDGDLSESPDAPTSIVLDAGSNRVVGIVDGGADARDYMTFTLDPGRMLLEIRLLRYQDAELDFIPGNRGFHALAEGPTSYIPDVSTASLFMGGDHLDPLIGTDLLAVLATAPLAGTGFEAPLGPGTYTYLVQQTSPAPTRYELELIVAVPEPSTALLVGVGLAVLSARRGRGRGGRAIG